VFNFLAYATTPLVAGARARNDIQASGRIVWQALTLAAVLGFLTGPLVGLLARPLIGLFGPDPGVVGPAVTYLRIRALAIPALLVITAGHGAYRGFHDTKTPLIVTLVANVLNAVLDPLLMFGAGMGLAGAAAATVIAQWIGAAAFLFLLRSRAERESWPRGSRRLRESVPLLRVGVVLILRTLMLVTSLSIATAAASRIGTVTVAAHQIVSQVWMLLAMTVDAIAIAGQAMVATELGRGDAEGARELSNRLHRWGLVLGVGLGLLVAASGRVLGAAFTPDPEVRRAVASAALIAGLMQPAAALVFVADGVFLALVRLKTLALSTGAGLAAMVAGVAVTLWLGGGIVGVWWSMTAMILARGLVLAIAYPSAFTASRS
jgi:MATE family multidrug resistance protein